MTQIPEIARLARERYAAGVVVREILAETGLSLPQLYAWVDGYPQPDGETLLPPLPRRRVFLRTRRDALRMALIRRMMRAAELQMREIEQRLAGAPGEPELRERDARLLAALAKTMRELIALDNKQDAGDGATRAAQAHDDAVPRDIDELRRELARRVDRLRQRRADAGAAGGG